MTVRVCARGTSNMADATGEEDKQERETKEKATESVQATNNQNTQGHKEGDSKQSAKRKVEVLLKAAGDAPIMAKKKWVVDGSKQIAYLIEFIKKYIKCEESESLFLYVGQAFAPSPDQIVQNLYDCFGADGKLVLHYCKSQAWG